MVNEHAFCLKNDDKCCVNCARYSFAGNSRRYLAVRYPQERKLSFVLACGKWRINFYCLQIIYMNIVMLCLQKYEWKSGLPPGEKCRLSDMIVLCKLGG